MSMQAADDASLQLPSINYSVASAQYRIGQRSNIAGIFVNKQSFSKLDDYDGTQSVPWNRTAGLDVNLATPDNRWSGNAYYHRTFDEAQVVDSTFSWGLGAAYESYRWQASTDLRSVGANFNPEVGFVRRTDFMRSRATVYHNFYPK